MTERFAVYYTPPLDHPLMRFGQQWLGRDARSGARLEPLSLPGFAADRLAQITEAPHHYGFHATLKAPFQLTEGTFAPDLSRAAAAFAAGRAPFAIRVKVDALGSFVAFVLAEQSPAMQALADDCVRAFEPFRAPLGAADLAKRLASGLKPRQIQRLHRWGYPYIFEDFVFHMTLSGRLPAEERQRLVTALRHETAAICAPSVPVDGIALFRQGDRASPFQLVERYPFDG